tara:strand:- start:624 stop:1130 length:507 start_codon:yes stop_codon:yes gene_type:complete
MNLYIKNFIDALLEKGFIQPDAVTEEVKDEPYPVGVVGELFPDSVVSLLPDACDEADEVLEDMREVLGDRVSLTLVEEGPVADGHQVVVEVDAERVEVSEEHYLMCFYELPKAINEHLKAHKDHYFVSDAFGGGEDMYLVYLPAALAEFVDDAQRNVDYTALETELPA